MSDAYDKNEDRLRRIREATEKAELNTPEPAADVVTQKIVQEIAEIKRQNDALAAKVKEGQQAQQKQAGELESLRNQQQQIIVYLNRQKERKAPAQPTLSEEQITTLITDKLLVFKVQLICVFVVVGVAVATAIYFWPENDAPESGASQPAAIRILERWEQ